MRLKNILTSCVATLAAVVTMSACSDILQEQPRSEYTPDFFSTEKGVENGITSLYAQLRWFYGGYFYAFTQNGTDEHTYGQQADGNFKNPDLTVGGDGVLSAANGDRSDVVWNNAFPNINTANGIIENGEAVGVAPSILAEAYFFRAWDYFMLVQTFGGVPLDLGSGELAFNTTPSTSSARNTVPEVYKAIFADLNKAVADLPDSPRKTGTVTKTVARFYLAKAYLTFAWWLENPNNVPTYPETTRVDLDGKSAAQYFQLAYDTATAAIANPGPYGLMPTFFEAHLAANDRNKEMLLYADHTENEQYGGISLGYSSGSSPENFAVWFATSQSAELVRSWDGKTFYTEDDGVKDLIGKPYYKVQAVGRDAVQEGGRPWTRMVPPIEVFTKTFADKTNDSRYDGTFVATQFGNWHKFNPGLASVTNANGMTVNQRGAILKFLPEDLPAGTVKYLLSVVGETNYNPTGIGAGEMAGESAFVIEPSRITRRNYPHLWKLGPARTDSGSGLGSPNGGSPRPWNIAKFSELYLIAAEAAVKGASGGQSARDLLNVLRARAGKWVHKNADGVWAGSGNYSADFSADMVAATPATIDINYVLAERSRELYGEGLRWYDLARTQKWEEIAGTYTIAGMDYNDSPEKVKTFTREIKKMYYLRPIPTTQFDRMEMDEAEKATYQNPGY